MNGAIQVSESVNEAIRVRSAKGWLPEPGDQIDGKVVKIIPRKTVLEGKTRVYPMIILNTGEPDYTAIHAFHSILLEQLKEAKLSPGDDLTIVYQGKEESKKLNAKGEPREYHSYIAIVNGGQDDSVEFDWDNDVTNADAAS